jgi:hypothetical protein
VILFAIGALVFVIGAVMFTIGAWLNALSNALLGKFVAAGCWTCVGIFMINAMSAAVSAGEWHGMMPEYVGIVIVAVVATIAKYALRIRRQSHV